MPVLLFLSVCMNSYACACVSQCLYELLRLCLCFTDCMKSCACVSKGFVWTLIPVFAFLSVCMDSCAT